MVVDRCLSLDVGRCHSGLFSVQLPSSTHDLRFGFWIAVCFVY